MEKCQYLATIDPYVKIEQVKFEIKTEEHEPEQLESETGIKFETSQEHNGILMHKESIQMKCEENEEKSLVQCPNESDKLNEVEKSNVSGDELNISISNSSEDTWKCCLCGFKNKDKNDLRDHITSTHKDPSNLNLFKCNLCDYRTEYLHKLGMHQPQHKNLTVHDSKIEQQIDLEAKSQRCGLCDVTYECKNDLGQHIMSSHKDPLDSNKFKCSICGYVTEYFHRLILHVSYHENPPDTNWYHCHKCSYRSRQKSNLKQHVLKHKDLLKADFYKCPSQSVAHSYLLKHLLKYKNSSEIELPRCKACDCNINFKSNLKSHMLKYKNLEEVKLYNCDMCEFRTKQKRSLNIHISRRHQDFL